MFISSFLLLTILRKMFRSDFLMFDIRKKVVKASNLRWITLFLLIVVVVIFCVGPLMTAPTKKH